MEDAGHGYWWWCLVLDVFRDTPASRDVGGVGRLAGAARACRRAAAPSTKLFDEAHDGDLSYARRRRRYRPAEALPPPAPPPNAMATPSMKPKSYQFPLFWTS